VPADADVSGADAVADGYAVADAAAVGIVSSLVFDEFWQRIALRAWLAIGD